MARRHPKSYDRFAWVPLAGNADLCLLLHPNNYK